MTYCLGILLPAGLVLASDARSNAGVDQVQEVFKMAQLTTPGQRVIVILSAGNLATTQWVVAEVRQRAGSGVAAKDVNLAKTMFDVAAVVGDTLREAVDVGAKYVEPYGDPSASFLVGGQLAGEPPRLFQIYSAGNFVEASSRTCFLQIGETKYGKPILDRALTFDSTLEHAAKLTLLSFDATVRSNLSVGLPIDLMRYETDSYAPQVTTFEAHNEYWRTLRDGYAQGLASVVDSLPPPPATLS